MALEGIIQAIVFPDKATIWVLALIYDENKALVDPTAVKISIIDPDDVTQVNEVSMTKYEDTTGIYEYFYHKGTAAAPMDTGQWRGEIITIDGVGESAVISPQSFAFEVR
jgi:hypothetical protein